MQTQPQPRSPGLRRIPAFIGATVTAILAAKGQKSDKFNEAKAVRDYHGVERAAWRILKERGLTLTDENYQLALNDIANEKLNDNERFRAAIAFEGDSSSIETATNGIAKVQPEVPLFMLVEMNAPEVDYGTGAWKKNERFNKLGAKLMIVAKAHVPVVSKYLQ